MIERWFKPDGPEALTFARSQSDVLRRWWSEVAIVRYLTLRPFGAEMLTPGVALWTLSARALVFLMAACEGVAWGYVGSLFSETWGRWPIAVCVGSAMFAVVWVIDAQFLTVDRAYLDHVRLLLRREPTAAENRGARAAMAGVLIRIAFVLASLTITAPFLSQLVFSRDIESHLSSGDTDAVSERRAALEQAHRAALEPIAAKAHDAQVRLEKEIGGAGASGRYGYGPTARSIEDEIASLTDEQTTLVARQTEETSNFESAVDRWQKTGDASELSSRWSVSMQSRGILGHWSAFQVVRASEEHAQVELVIKAFLALLFLGVLILKFYEMSSCKLYFSEILQDYWQAWRAGAYDRLLPERDRSGATPCAMTPRRFEKFLTDTWELREEAGLATAAHETMAAARRRERTQEEERHRDVLEQARREHAAREDEHREAIERTRREREAREAEQAAAAAEKERINEAEEAERERSRSRIRRELDEIDAMRDAMLHRMAEFQARLTEDQERCDAAILRFESLKGAIGIVERDLGELRTGLGTASTAGPEQPYDEFAVAELKTKLRRHLARAQRKLDELRSQRPLVEEQAASARSAATEAKIHLDDVWRRLQQLESRRAEVEERLLD